MSAYGALAAWYDALTRDVDYAAFADFYEQCFQQGRGESHTLLDFCCGTGTLTRLMAARGYEMIATDGSPDMLMQAQAHNAQLRRTLSRRCCCVRRRPSSTFTARSTRPTARSTASTTCRRRSCRRCCTGCTCSCARAGC